MTNSFAANFLTEQRKRMVGTLMRYLEDNVYDSLTAPQQQALRKKVLTTVAQYHDVCLDLIKASVNDGTVANEETARLLTGMAADIRELRHGGD